MERTLASLLPIQLVFFVLSASPCAGTPGPSISMVFFIDNQVNWSAAQTYCRLYHSDMVTIRNPEEAEKLHLYEGWTGLHHDRNDEWRWSSGDEQAVFFNWDSGEMASGELKDPLGNKKCVWKREWYLGWKRDQCHKHHPFLCVETLILVKEKKTWEKALQHCRELPPPVGEPTHTYDLASLNEAHMEIMLSTTNEVWVGLRFLAGEWMWMNGQAASNLPLCPAWQQHCGALVHDKAHWKIVVSDCSEEKSFFCSTKQ